MEIKKQANFNENYSLRILEKFAEIKGIPFDSIQAISELEQFRRLQSDLKKENHFEELAAIGKKMGRIIFFIKTPNNSRFNSKNSVSICIKLKSFNFLQYIHL